MDLEHTICAKYTYGHITKYQGEVRDTESSITEEAEKGDKIL
jgi:hypothetical protein